jgi:hypothetical protein
VFGTRSHGDSLCGSAHPLWVYRTAVLAVPSLYIYSLAVLLGGLVGLHLWLL